ncbi:transmembrane protein, putative, partial [Bodo saltans]
MDSSAQTTICLQRDVFPVGLASPNAIDFPALVAGTPYPAEGLAPVSSNEMATAPRVANPNNDEDVNPRPVFLSWELDEPDDSPMEPVVIVGGGGGRSEMFHQTNMMMDTMQESNRKRNRKCGRSASTVSSHGASGGPNVFARHRWSLRYRNPVVEHEFLVYHYSTRSMAIVNIAGQVVVCVVGVALYSGLSRMTIALYMCVCVLWISCGIGTIILRHVMQRFTAESADRIVARTGHIDDDVTDAPVKDTPLPSKAFELSIASNSTPGSVRGRAAKAGTDVTHSLLVAYDPARIPMRRNAQLQEYVFMVVLVANFLFAVANFSGKGTCFNSKWDYAMELRGCRRAIQMDSVPLLLFITSTFANPTRWISFTAIYIICTIANLASRTAPPMIALIPAYFWASVTVFGIEALACII